MIIIKLMGGLGNQMFQYAASRSLAESLHVPLKLDLSFLSDKSPKENFTYREYALGPYGLQEDIISSKELDSFLKKARFFARLKIQGFNWRLLQNRLPIPKVISHYDLVLYPSFFSLSRNTYLDGYWQSEKYFSSLKDLIRKCFEISDPDINNSVDGILNKRDQGTAVSVHVRRGDYAQNAHIKSVHGLCPISYYTEAMEFISLKIADPVFFFISDDMDWVNENFTPFEKKYKMVFQPGKNEYHDLLLMQKCKHNIIANSSFSWWGAWLNSYSDRIIIAPKNWFADKSINDKITDLIPMNWIRI
jgi:hypothetical protein